MSLRSALFGVCALLAGCSSSLLDLDDIRISGFHSEEPERCQPSDVALDERQIASFSNAPRLLMVARCTMSLTGPLVTLKAR